MGSNKSRRWRHYETKTGRRPVFEFIRDLSDEHAALIFAAMHDVRRVGLSEARHLDEDIWEVRVDAPPVIYCILFSSEGEKSQILLSLEAFTKKTQKTPKEKIRLAKKRLSDWRSRGRERNNKYSQSRRGDYPRKR